MLKLVGPVGTATRDRASRTGEESFSALYRLRYPWEDRVHELVASVKVSGRGFESITVHSSSACCGYPFINGWEWDDVVCSRCRKAAPLAADWPLLALVVTRDGPTLRGRRELFQWWDLATWNPLEATLALEAVLGTLEAAGEVLKATLSGEDLLPGLQKKYVRFPGETKKRTLTAHLGRLVARAIDPEAPVG